MGVKLLRMDFISLACSFRRSDRSSLNAFFRSDNSWAMYGEPAVISVGGGGENHKNLNGIEDRDAECTECC